MRRKLRYLINVVCLICISFGYQESFAESEAPPTIAFTFSMPPYLSHDLKSGIELEIIKSALKATGQDKLEVKNVHYLRALELAKAGQVDLISSNVSNEIYAKELSSVYTSDATINYIDCAISLQSKNLKLDEIKDFYDKRIWAFKSASLSLGDSFREMTVSNPQYTEDFDQLKQVDMLAMGRIDVAISDRNIFSSKLLKREGIEQSNFKFDKIGPPTPRAVRSTSKKLIDRINQGLTIIRKNRVYQEILLKYQHLYSESCH